MLELIILAAGLAVIISGAKWFAENYSDRAAALYSVSILSLTVGLGSLISIPTMFFGSFSVFSSGNKDESLTAMSHAITAPFGGTGAFFHIVGGIMFGSGVITAVMLFREVQRIDAKNGS